MTPSQLPLRSLRVVDVSDAVGEAAARLLADLGAETIKVVPPSDETRAEWPVVDGQSLSFAVRNANKTLVEVDLEGEAGRSAIVDLIAGADIAFVDNRVAELLDVDDVVNRHPELVVVVSSPFGRTGPRRDWVATERTLLALSGSLSRSGRPGGVPLLPPDGLVQATASTHAAWTALVAHRHARRTSVGQVIDLSAHEAVAIGLDPAFGVQGSAAAGRSGKVRRDRPPADSYPVYPCGDGYVRLCLLAKRQWRGMFSWLGEPEEFADPAFDSIAARVAAADRLDPLIADLFGNQKGADLVEEAARRGVPLAQVLTLGDALVSPHFTAAGSVTEIELLPGRMVTVPTGCVDLDGVRAGLRSPAVRRQDDRHEWTASSARTPGAASAATLPFDGLRVLDLGVIVFGAEVGRAFADLGADVIKVESLAFPDGLRQTRDGAAMNASFAWGQRNKRSLGLDLRSEDGKAIFLRLVAQSDVVLSNFKPGTLEGLGIDHPTLAEVNPGIVVLESAAFSSRGPWARRLGYGPLVRAACGISSLWKYAEQDTECWDGVTVFPDHVAAKVAAIAVAAVLHEQEETGLGRAVEVPQSDVVLHQLAPLAAYESLVPGSAVATGNEGRTAFGGVFACAGDDEWCVIDARDEHELAALRDAVQGRGDLHQVVSAWAAERTPHEVMETLQAVRVPAAAMLRLPELLDDPQLAARRTYVPFRHPALGHELPTENTASAYSSLPDVAPRPAPAVGEHTRDVLSSLLGLDDGAYDELLARGVVHDGSMV